MFYFLELKLKNIRNEIYDVLDHLSQLTQNNDYHTFWKDDLVCPPKRSPVVMLDWN